MGLVELVVGLAVLAVVVYFVWKKLNPTHVAEVTASVETQATADVAVVEADVKKAE
jgi:uncharacterized protein YpmB